LSRQRQDNETITPRNAIDSAWPSTIFSRVDSTSPRLDVRSTIENRPGRIWIEGFVPSSKSLYQRPTRLSRRLTKCGNIYRHIYLSVQSIIASQFSSDRVADISRRSGIIQSLQIAISRLTRASNASDFLLQKHYVPVSVGGNLLHFAISGHASIIAQ
jgi:hypothetical protein